MLQAQPTVGRVRVCGCVSLAGHVGAQHHTPVRAVAAVAETLMAVVASLELAQDSLPGLFASDGLPASSAHDALPAQAA